MTDLRKIDALVDEHVMGWGCYIVPNYSSDITAAWEVVEKMEGEWFNLSAASPKGWYAAFGSPDNESTYGDTAPLAICLAALKTKGIDIKAQEEE